MVKMRLTRMGDKKSPFYRVVVVDGRNARGGQYIEQVGTYDPKKNPAEVKIDVEIAKKWLANGVQPTETVKNLLVKAGAMPQSTQKSPTKTGKKKKEDK